MTFRRIALSVLLTFACAITPGPNPDVNAIPKITLAAAEGKQFTLSEELSFCDSPEPTCIPTNSYSLATLRDLYILVQWENVSPPGTHTQEVKVFLPADRNGTLYQSFSNSFLAPHGHNKSLTIIDDFPVGGTPIERRELTGNWLVEVYLDDALIGSGFVEFTP